MASLRDLYRGGTLKQEEQMRDNVMSEKRVKHHVTLVVGQSSPCQRFIAAPPPDGTGNTTIPIGN